MAFNGKQALELILQKASHSLFYEVILMDCNMPKIDGLQATVLLKELIRKHVIPNLIIVACTANTSPSDFESFEGLELAIT